MEINEQEKREKVIKELECCVSLNHNGPKCANCDYADEFHNGDCETYLLRDALALLKAQEQKCRECGEATSKAIQELQAKLKAQEIGKVNITITQSDEWKEGNCPFCGMKVDSFYNWSFCGTCGKGLKWDG